MQHQRSVHIVLLCTFKMNIVESSCWVVRCCPLTVQLQLNLASLCVGFMVDEQALKQIFFSRSCQFSLFTKPAFFNAHVSLYPRSVAAPTRQHIIASSTFKFWSSLADDTWLFTH